MHLRREQRQDSTHVQVEGAVLGRELFIIYGRGSGVHNSYYSARPGAPLWTRYFYEASGFYRVYSGISDESSGKL